MSAHAVCGLAVVLGLSYLSAVAACVIFQPFHRRTPHTDRKETQ